MSARIIVIFVMIGLASPLQAENCKPVSDTDVGTITTYIAKRSELPVDSVKLKSSEDVEGTCYRKLVLESGTTSQRRLLTFYLSPDRKYLSSNLFDLTLNPDVEREKLAAELRKVLTSDTSPTRGNNNAPVTIVEFSDFQCPYCQRFESIYKGLPQDVQQRVRLVYKELPLPMHPWAQPAASIAVCASVQSNEAFWQVHDFFFSNQAELNSLNLTERLKSVRALDVDSIQQCVNSKKAQPVLDRDQALASELRVTGTPTIFVNGKRVTVQTSDQLELEIHRALDKIAQAQSSDRKAGGQL